jgi:hypothetical protein
VEVRKAAVAVQVVVDALHSEAVVVLLEEYYVYQHS